MAPSLATISLNASPGLADGRGRIRIGETWMLTAARQSVLPAVLDLAPTTLIFITLILVYVVGVRRIRPPIRPIELSRHTRHVWRAERTSSASAEEELGLDRKTQRLLPEHLTTSPLDTIFHGKYQSVQEPPPLRLNMANQKRQSTPSVLQPKTRTPTPHSGLTATVALPQGRYTGVLLPASSSLPRAVEAWRGIPYAQSTGGENRFRPPVPLPVAAGHASVVAVVADLFGPICPGTAARTAAAEGESEDCLNLNVYRPVAWREKDGVGDEQVTMRTMMPVIVYVHGGAFNGGSGTERDMASFVSWAATPVLAVSFNYRVGALGFPSSVVADREGCLNLGLRDQQMLFEWVRSNIGAFGGDGGRVTVMGMSAGAHSIGYHLQSPSSLTNAPFHGAIMESGGATARATLSPSHPRTEAQWREFLLAAGVQPDSTRPEQILPLLRSLPLEAILRASGAVFSRYQDPIRWPFQPVIESGNDKSGGIITDLPIEKFRRGEFLKVPILTGFNSNEGTVFCSPRVETNEEFLEKFTIMIPRLSTPDLAALTRVYPDPVSSPTSPHAKVPPGFGRQWSRYEAAYAHYAYICPVLQTGHFYSSQPHADKTRTDEAEFPVWVYEFAALSRPDYGGKANHVDEAVVVSHNMNVLAPFPGLVETSDAMHGAWVRFIATGDPNPASAPAPALGRNNNNNNNNNNFNEKQEEEEEKKMPVWPRFSSPFVGDSELSPGRLRRKGKSSGEAEGCGRVMVFGSGNTERMGDAGGRDWGTPAKVVGLTDGEVEECGFWWERVELSEGMGRRLHGDKARL